MGQALQWTDHVAALGGDRRIILVGNEIAAHAGGQVEDHIGVAFADALDDLAVERHITRALAGFRVAYMAVRNGRARLGRLDGRVGDLFRRNRQLGMHISRITGPGYGAGYNYFVVHGDAPLCDISASPASPQTPGNDPGQQEFISPTTVAAAACGQ